ALGVVEALIALCVSPSAQGFTASELARRVRLLSNQSESDYGPRRAAYEQKKLRAKEIVRRIERRNVELSRARFGFWPLISVSELFMAERSGPAQPGEARL